MSCSVDEEKRQIWFSASGMYPGKDPYFVHYYRINFDGTGLTHAHAGRRQPHGDVLGRPASTTWTPIRASTRRRSPSCIAPPTASLVAELERGDISELTSAGWKPPEVFAAKGRDGKTDIWGVIYRPIEFRSGEEISGHREHLRRPAGLVRPEDVRRLQPDAGAGRARLHRRADRRHGHEQSLEGFPRCRVEEPQGRRLPRSHPLAQSGRREVSVVRHHARRHLRHVGRRTERARRAAVPSRLLQGRRRRRPAATTTAWTRSGGTNSGWDGRSDPNTPRHPTSTTPTGCRARCC